MFIFYQGATFVLMKFSQKRLHKNFYVVKVGFWNAQDFKIITKIFTGLPKEVSRVPYVCTFFSHLIGPLKHCEQFIDACLFSLPPATYQKILKKAGCLAASQLILKKEMARWKLPRRFAASPFRRLAASLPRRFAASPPHRFAASPQVRKFWKK